MTAVLALVVGTLFAAGVYMLARRSIVKLVIGLALISHAANLLIFTAGGLVRHVPPIVGADGLPPPGPVADPLPQALVLTAIVIGFAVLSFVIVLLKQVASATGTADLDELRATDS